MKKIILIMILALALVGCHKLQAIKNPESKNSQTNSRQGLKNQPIAIAKVVSRETSPDDKPYVIIWTLHNRVFILNDLSKITLEVNDKLDGTYVDVSWPCEFGNCDHEINVTEMKVYVKTKQEADQWQNELNKAMNSVYIPLPARDVPLGR